MPVRLTASRGGRIVQRAVLDVGRHVAGSAVDADLVLDDPTVSRRHLALVVGERLMVEDLGSSNGSRLGATRLRIGEPAPWPSGEPLLLGEVALQWSTLADDDAGLALATGLPVDAAPGRAERTLDVSMGSRFTTERLARLLQRVREGVPLAVLAREAGEALCVSTGCSGLRIDDRAGAVLFATGKDAGGMPSLRATGDSIAITLTPGSDAPAEAWRPVLDTLVALLSLARDDVHVEAPRAEPSVPDAPESLTPAVRRIYDGAARAARGRLNVLIRGESGPGKEVLACHIHARAGGGDVPFVAVNCSALPENLLEAELFGIEKGVATGVDARAGKFEQAHGGILFLDEIGDMPAATQARILRALQEESVLRVGGTRPRPAEVMVISATHRDIDAMIAEGSFRLDLFHRLADWEVELPPLRERRADIPNLALHFLTRAADRLGTPVAGLSQRAVDALLGYDWPGNIRQLEREMRRLAAFSAGGELVTSEDLDPRITGHLQHAAPAGATLDAQLEYAERRILADALARHEGNVSRSAEALGISRSRMYRRMEQLGLHEPAPTRLEE